MTLHLTPEKMDIVAWLNQLGDELTSGKCGMRDDFEMASQNQADRERLRKVAEFLGQCFEVAMTDTDLGAETSVSTDEYDKWLKMFFQLEKFE